MFVNRKFQSGRYCPKKPVYTPVSIDWTPVVVVLVVILIALIAIGAI